MGILKKILSPRYLFAFLVIAGVTIVPVLQSTPDQCVSTTDGDLSEQSTFGQYQGITQSGCGSNLAMDYIIGQGTSVSWSGFEGPITGSVEVKTGATLEINGNANFESSLTNAGSLTVQHPTHSFLAPGGAALIWVSGGISAASSWPHSMQKWLAVEFPVAQRGQGLSTWLLLC